MSDLQLDVNKIIESLSGQITAQAQRIAILEATIHSLKIAIEQNRNNDTSDQK